MFTHENHIKSFFIMLVPFVVIVSLIYYANKKHEQWLSTSMGGCPGCNETPAQQEQDTASAWNNLLTLLSKPSPTVLPQPQNIAQMPVFVDDSGNRPFPFMQHQGLTVDQIRRGM